MQSGDAQFQTYALRALRRVLTPLARLLLRAGIGFREFSDVCKEAFVSVATQDFGVRGRPTNISRVSAVTGLSRKEVSRIRDLAAARDLTSTLGWNALTVVLHHWHYDPVFSSSPGSPRALEFLGGDASFAALVRKYAGDIPPGAVRAELKRGGAITESDSGLIAPVKHWFAPAAVDGTFFDSMSFSLSSLASTIAYNAAVLADGRTEEDPGRLERYVWASRISNDDADAFKALAESRAFALVEELERWVAEKERDLDSRVSNGKEPAPVRTVGLGFYYFERDREPGDGGDDTGRND